MSAIRQYGYQKPATRNEASMPRKMTSNSPPQLNGTSRRNGCALSGPRIAAKTPDIMDIGFRDSIVGGDAKRSRIVPYKIAAGEATGTKRIARTRSHQ